MKFVYPVPAIKNQTTDQLAQDLALAIFTENKTEYARLIENFKSLNVKNWEIYAFQDRVHWLVRCHKEKRNTVTGEIL